jgi:hypothetical protein
LRDPRWQKKRLEVMQRDRFACQECDATDKTLNVHHCFYEYGNDPWEYPDQSLVTLCEECHEFEAEAKSFQKDLIKCLCSLGWRRNHFLAFEYTLWELFLNSEKEQLHTVSAKRLAGLLLNLLIEKFPDALGGSTNSDASKSVPTGEGSSAGDKVERKSDAAV